MGSSNAKNLFFEFLKHTTTHKQDTFSRSIDKESNLENLRRTFNATNMEVRNQHQMETVEEILFKLQKDLADVPGSSKGQKVSVMVDLMRYLYENQGHVKKLAVYVRRQEEPKTKNRKTLKIYQETSNPLQIDIWCFDASRAIKALKEESVGSMIFTSGTLSPVSSYISDIGLSHLSTTTLKGTHVIGQDQLFVGTLSKSDGIELKNVFQNRQNEHMFRQMGETIQKVQGVTEGGLLVFHPTYNLMSLATQYWGGIQFETEVNNEATDGMDLVLAQFENSLMVKGKSILQGVCRGKVSEGVDFADDRGRVAFITGIPYAPLLDPKVKLKIDSIKRNGGYNWYQVQAMRAINQAVGRIIRHRFDFGAIIFLDSRFSLYQTRKLLPSWVERSHQMFESSDKLLLAVKLFFNKVKAISKRWKISNPTPSVVSVVEKVGKEIEKKVKKVTFETTVCSQTEGPANLDATLSEFHWKRLNSESNSESPPRKKVKLFDEKYNQLCGDVPKHFHIRRLSEPDKKTLDDLREEFKFFLLFVEELLNRIDRNDVWRDFVSDFRSISLRQLKLEDAIEADKKWVAIFESVFGEFLCKIIMVFFGRILSHRPYQWLTQYKTYVDEKYQMHVDQAWKEIAQTVHYFKDIAQKE